MFMHSQHVLQKPVSFFWHTAKASRSGWFLQRIDCFPPQKNDFHGNVSCEFRHDITQEKENRMAGCHHDRAKSLRGRLNATDATSKNSIVARLL
jgi:hypothetical protein